MSSPFLRRVNESLKEAIADEISRLTDPGLGMITITGVDTAPDLRSARVYYSVLGDDEQFASRPSRPWQRANAHVRSAIGKRVRLKYLPELRFEQDTALEQGMRIERLLTETPRARGVRVTTEAMDLAVRALRDAESFVVSGHIGPDGDALGSALAFAHAARLAGKQAVVAFGGTFVMPDAYAYLDTTPLVDRSEVSLRLPRRWWCSTSAWRHVSASWPISQPRQACSSWWITTPIPMRDWATSR